MKTDVFNFSKAGVVKLVEMSENMAVYMDFLKFQVRIFKHNTNVALEFFAQKPETKFIADESQWKRSGYTVSEGSEAIRFSDEHGNQRDLFDFSQVEEENEPQIWTVTKENAAEIKAALGIPSGKKLINGLMSAMVTPSQIASCMESLNVPPNNFDDFRKLFLSAVQTIIAGRLEVGGNIFKVTPDLSAMKMLKTEFDKMDFLTFAAYAARKPLNRIEQIITLINAKKLNERNEKNELHGVERSDRAGAKRSTGQRTSDNTAGETAGENTLGADVAQGRSESPPKI